MVMIVVVIGDFGVISRNTMEAMSWGGVSSSNWYIMIHIYIESIERNISIVLFDFLRRWKRKQHLLRQSILFNPSASFVITYNPNITENDGLLQTISQCHLSHQPLALTHYEFAQV